MKWAAALAAAGALILLMGIRFEIGPVAFLRLLALIVAQTGFDECPRDVIKQVRGGFLLALCDEEESPSLALMKMMQAAAEQDEAAT